MKRTPLPLTHPPRLPCVRPLLNQRCIDLDQKHMTLPAWLQKRQQPGLHYLQPLVFDMAARRKEREMFETGKAK